MVPKTCRADQKGDEDARVALFGVVAEELLEAGVVAQGREGGVGVDGGEIAIAELKGFLQGGKSS